MVRGEWRVAGKRKGLRKGSGGIWEPMSGEFVAESAGHGAGLGEKNGAGAEGSKRWIKTAASLEPSEA